MFMIIILGLAEGMDNMMKMKNVSSKISTHHSSSTKTKDDKKVHKINIYLFFFYIIYI